MPAKSACKAHCLCASQNVCPPTPRAHVQPQDSSNLPMGVGAASIGLELDASFRAKSFVDIFGAGFGRDIEPTQARLRALDSGFRV